MKSSLEATLEEARKFGASPDEVRLIHNVVQANTSPEIVRDFEIKFGPDSLNNRAVWVQLVVDNDLNPSHDKISRLTTISKKIRSALLQENLNYWPYVEYRGRS